MSDLRGHPKVGARDAIDRGAGILRLLPTWVPRSFGSPGRRLRLHPADHHAAGRGRGAIVERWLSSTVPADNGPSSPPDEGLSWVVASGPTNGGGPTGDGDVGRILLAEVLTVLGPALLGPAGRADAASWSVLTKLFDYDERLPLHLHQDDAAAALVGRVGKPESHYFPPQLNNHLGRRPTAFLGLRPSITRDAFLYRVRQALERGGGLVDLSVGYGSRLGSGWDVPVGILHAPGSLCTYEVQVASDVFAMVELEMGGSQLPEDLAWKDAPPERRGDLSYLLDIIDWDANVNPTFADRHELPPLPVESLPDLTDGGASGHWVAYRSSAFSAQEVRVEPGRSATLRDPQAYGVLVVQGHGRIGPWPVAAPTMIRYGQATDDEFFVTAPAASAGVRIVNASACEPLVLLRHFGPGHPGLPVSRDPAPIR